MEVAGLAEYCTDAAVGADQQEHTDKGREAGNQARQIIRTGRRLSDAVGSRVDGALARTSDVVAVLVGCGHVSGLLMRQERPLALMLCADRVPNKISHLEVR